MAYKFTMQGILKDLGSTKVREVTFDNGELTGDLVLIEELNHYASLYEIDGDFKIGYVPHTGNFIEDAMAVIMIFFEICRDAKIKGNFPKYDGYVPEGVDY